MREYSSRTVKNEVVQMLTICSLEDKKKIDNAMYRLKLNRIISNWIVEENKLRITYGDGAAVMELDLVVFYKDADLVVLKEDRSKHSRFEYISNRM